MKTKQFDDGIENTLRHPDFKWAFRLDEARHHKVQQKYVCNVGQLEELSIYLELHRLEAFAIELMVKPKRSSAYFDIYMKVSAKGDQVCIATGDPVGFEEEIAETHNVTVELADSSVGELQLSETDLDAPEYIENGKFDPLKVALEMLILELDPYPRKQGIDLVNEQDAQLDCDLKPNPFAGLSVLKGKI